MKKLHLVILALCVVGLFQGCENSVTQKKLRLVFVGGTPDNYWSVVRLGCDFATRQLNDVDLDFRFLENGTSAAQQELLSTLVTNGTDGIVISPIDPETQMGFLNNLATNTLLVCADSDAAKSQRRCYIGADNV
ncbi:MAG: substrate-binding domain-containing protein, partial [Limisphaerales bacterium]